MSARPDPGTRLRWSPKVNGRNADWNWVDQRWKTESDYAADELALHEVVARVACDFCGAKAGTLCVDQKREPTRDPHPNRRRMAGIDVAIEREQVGQAGTADRG